MDHNPTAHLRPFSFLHRSPGVVSAGLTDEDGLLRTRRQNSHKSAPLLDLSRGEKRDRHLPLTSASAESSEQIQTHISGTRASFGDQELEKVTPGQCFQYSELRSSHALDSTVASASASAGGSVKHIQPSHQHRQQPFFLARSSQNPTSHHRKTLHERLQGEQSQPQQSRFGADPPSYSTQPTRSSYQAVPSLMPESTSSFSNYVEKNARDFRTVADMEASENQGSLMNLKTEDTEVKTRSRSASVLSASVDVKGMQGVVMEAMKSIQRYESENEMQVGQS